MSFGPLQRSATALRLAPPLWYPTGRKRLPSISSVRLTAIVAQVCPYHGHSASIKRVKCCLGGFAANLWHCQNSDFVVQGGCCKSPGRTCSHAVWPPRAVRAVDEQWSKVRRGVPTWSAFERAAMLSRERRGWWNSFECIACWKGTEREIFGSSTALALRSFRGSQSTPLLSP